MGFELQLCIIQVDTIWMWVICFTLRPLCLQGYNPGCCRIGGWVEPGGGTDRGDKRGNLCPVSEYLSSSPSHWRSSDWRNLTHLQRNLDEKDLHETCCIRKLLILLYLDLVSSMFELLPYASLKCSNNITDLIFLVKTAGFFFLCKYFRNFSFLSPPLCLPLLFFFFPWNCAALRCDFILHVHYGWRIMVHYIGLQIEQICFHLDNLARFLSQRMSFTFLAQFLLHIVLLFSTVISCCFLVASRR